MKSLCKLVTGAALLKGAQMLPAAAGAVAVFGKTMERKLKKAQQKKKGEITMKKSTLVALLVFLSAVAGALAAAYFYLVKREKELDEYEQMLFSEDYDDEDGCAGCEAGAAPEQNASEE